jgi:glycerol-3-phosphate acyltransferase PlsX
MLRATSLPIDFKGFVEGDDIAAGTVDVVVTDGFTGNIALKTAEGAVKFVIEFLRSSMRRSLFGRLGGLFARGALDALKRKLDPRTSNGAIFLGLNGLVVKSHGGTDEIGFASALDVAIDMARSGVISRIVADRARIRGPMPEAAAS